MTQKSRSIALTQVAQWEEGKTSRLEVSTRDGLVNQVGN